MRTPLRTLLVALLLVGLLPGVSAADPEDVRQDLQSARERLAELDATVSQAVEEYNVAADRLERLERTRDETEGRVETLTAEVAELEERTAAFVRSMYIRGPSTGMDTLFDSTEVAAAGRDLLVMDRISRQRHGELEQLAVRRGELDEAREALDVQVQEARHRAAELEQEREEVEALIAAQRDEVDRLREDLAEAERAQAEAERRAREEAARRAAAEEAAAAEAAARQAAEQQAAEQATEPTTDPAPAPTSEPPPPEPEPAPEGTRSGAQTAVDAALSQVGKPYEWGAEGPDSYDCSGLTKWAWAHAGVRLSHSSRIQYAETSRISRSQLQPGDLIFYNQPISHVAMYIGDGKVVEAPYTGANVRVRSMTRTDITGYGRV